MAILGTIYKFLKFQLYGIFNQYSNFVNSKNRHYFQSIQFVYFQEYFIFLQFPHFWNSRHSDHLFINPIFGIPIIHISPISSISGSMFRSCVLKSSRQIWRAVGRSEAVLSMGVRSLSCVYCIFVTIRTLQERSVLIANLSPVTRSFSSVKKITLVGNLFALYNEKGYHRDDEKFDTRAYEEEAEEREELEELKDMEEMEEIV